jgi:membrane fusion protein
LGSLLALIAALVGLASFLTYPRSVAITGKIVPVSPPADVHSPRTGVITHLLVSEGTRVAAGQPVARLEVEQRRERLPSSTEAVLTALQQRRALVQGQLALSHNSHRQELTSMAEARASLNAQLTELAGQIGTVQRSIALSERSLNDVRPLTEQGFISRSEIARREQGVLAQKVQEQALRQQRAALRGQIAELSVRMAEVRRTVLEGATDLAGSLSDIDAQIARTSEDRAIMLTAPLAGRVTAIRTAVGQLAPTDAFLLSISPGPSVFQAELHASPAELAHLSPGQRAELELEGYPASSYGTMPAVVRSISGVPVAINEATEAREAPPLMYVVRLDVLRPAEGRLREVALVNGLPVRAKIMARERSLIQLVLDTVLGR